MTTTLTKTAVNAFAMKRNKSASPSTPKSVFIPRTDSVTMDDVQETDDDDQNIANIDDDETASQSAMLTTSTRRPRKCQLSDLCNLEDDSIDEPVNETVGEPINK